MFGFTKQEKRFLIVLIVSFIAGLCLDIDNKKDIKTEKTWKTKQNFEINSLENITLTSNQKENKKRTSEDFLTDNQTVLTKKSLVEKININTASFKELQLLPQIGPVLAKNIIEYRNRYGSFKTIEEILRVTKIGPKTFNKIEKSITVK